LYFERVSCLMILNLETEKAVDSSKRLGIVSSLGRTKSSFLPGEGCWAIAFKDALQNISWKKRLQNFIAARQIGKLLLNHQPTNERLRQST
jgi:hypothetical protein